MRKFPKLKYPSDPETDGVLAGEVVVTEKLDGANFRMEVTGDGIEIGTRNHVYPLHGENLPVAFEHARQWVIENVEEDDEVRNALENQGTFFGEAMHKHSIIYSDVEYNHPPRGSAHFGEGYPSVVLFDWWHRDSWQHWDAFEDITEQLGLPTTNVIERGDGQHLKDAGGLEIPEESMFGGSPEGIVVRRVDGTVRAKKVSQDFKEKNAQAFDDPSKAQSDAAEFVAAFVTQPRIEKMANKLVDSGAYSHISMEMMQDLPRGVINDVFAEEGWNLICHEYGFEAEFDEDFKDEVRSKASKKCARKLKELTQEF